MIPSQVNAAYVRSLIVGAALPLGREITRRMIRRAARKVIERHMRQFFISDFADEFVGQRHRDWLLSARQNARARLTACDSASSTPELLDIFDAIAGRL